MCVVDEHGTCLGPLPALDLPEADLAREHGAEQHVADVGEHVVEVRERAERVGAQEVVVAQVLVAGLEHHLRKHPASQYTRRRGGKDRKS